MRTLFLLTTVLFFTTAPTLVQGADEAAAKPDRNYNLDEPSASENDVPGQPYVLQVKKFGLTPEAFRKSAIKSLLKYHWVIDVNEATRVQGNYLKSGKTYKVELRFTGDTVVIAYVPGFHHTKRGWLKNVATEFKREAVAFSREAEAQRYLN
jgi:hypothetical protein